jgi:hypothetical protein
MIAHVLRNGERVRIDGIPSYAEVGGPVCTFAGAMAAALAVTAHPLNAEEILALSGYAFHTRWCLSDGRPTGCPGSVSLEQGFLLPAFSGHSGWQIKVLYDQGWDRPDMQRAIPDMIASIDAGRPVVIEDEYTNAAVLYGYVRGGDRYLVNTYAKGPIEAALSDLGQDPALAFVLGAYTEPPPFPTVFRGVLHNAITWWHREHEPDTCGGPNMRIGGTALEHWARFYGSIDELAPAYARGKGGLLYNSLMNYHHLYENRKAAASYLAKHAPAFPRAEAVLRKAAETYRQEAEVLAAALAPDDDAWRALNQVRTALVRRDPASIPWEAARSVAPADAWTPALQQRERRIMEEALQLERSAIACLEEAYAQVSS